MPLLLRNDTEEKREPKPMTRPVPGGLVRSPSKKLLTSDGVLIEEDDDEILLINKKKKTNVETEDEKGIASFSYTNKGEPVDLTGRQGGFGAAKKKFCEGKVCEGAKCIIV